MAVNTNKTPLATSLNRFADKKIDNARAIDGKGLPCRVISVSGAIATIALEVNLSPLPVVRVPIAESRYVRLPVQVGDLGVVRSSDVRIGGVTGLGTGVANLAPPANLGALVYEPVGNANWPSVDPNAVVISGPNGVVLQDDSGASVVTLTPSGITLSSNGHSIVIDGSGVTIDGKAFLTHMHTDVQSGSSDTGPVA